MLEEALRQVEELADLPPILVLAGPEWHEGVVGIVASRLVERYHRPTILLGVRARWPRLGAQHLHTIL